ncbi:hypothetical protein [Polaribacter sp. 11A2H]|uniref:hypothetical protein n=1 Tax=Polaribacter sp. 11A2H TaxID=2687290 RepID=UPI001407DAF5|nr:hypothetical protein [Polaribacter sp. 11A2H]
MIKNAINSFSDNINQKLKNPFLGTFIIIWTIRNWEFIYSLFFFDSETKLNGRLEMIKSFFIDYGILEILITIGLTFLILIITYVLLNLSRLIINFFDKIITPKIYKLTDESTIVLKEDFDKLKIEINRLETKVQEERELRLKIQNENDNLEKRTSELLIQPKESENKNNDKIDLIINKLKSRKELESFQAVAAGTLNDYSYSANTEYIKFFTTMGLIKRSTHNGEDDYYYNLTENGKEVHERILLAE